MDLEEFADKVAADFVDREVLLFRRHWSAERAHIDAPFVLPICGPAGMTSPSPAYFPIRHQTSFGTLRLEVRFQQ